MKIFRICMTFLLLALPAFAITHGYAKYVGGTAQGFSTRTIGQLDTTSDSVLRFKYFGNTISIPYASINSPEYSTEVARHLGVLPAIAVALFKARQYRHFFRISYRDSNDVPQIVVFEVPKQTVRMLQAVLDARVSHPAKFPPYACVPPRS